MRTGRPKKKPTKEIIKQLPELAKGCRDYFELINKLPVSKTVFYNSWLKDPEFKEFQDAYTKIRAVIDENSIKELVSEIRKVAMLCIDDPKILASKLRACEYLLNFKHKWGSTKQDQQEKDEIIEH